MNENSELRGLNLAAYAEEVERIQAEGWFPLNACTSVFPCANCGTPTHSEGWALGAQLTGHYREFIPCQSCGMVQEL